MFRSLNLISFYQSIKALGILKSPLFQFKNTFSDIRIFLTPKGVGETSVFVEKTNSSCQLLFSCVFLSVLGASLSGHHVLRCVIVQFLVLLISFFVNRMMDGCVELMRH